jgi:hypothetical protein
MREVATHPSTGGGWVRRANDRPRGATEFREVTMEIGRGGRRLRLRTVRETVGEVARTVFCVEEPWMMRNINYVATERRGRVKPFPIQLFLPYVLGTLRDVPSERRGEGLLGSDFCYDDFREWLPEEGHNYDLGEAAGGGVRVTGRCVSGPPLARAGHSPFHAWIDEESGFVRGIDYAGVDGRVARVFRVEETTPIHEVLIPARMSMLDVASGHLTAIHLERAWIGRPIEPRLWEREFRKQTRDYLSTL